MRFAFPIWRIIACKCRWRRRRRRRCLTRFVRHARSHRLERSTAIRQRFLLGDACLAWQAFPDHPAPECTERAWIRSPISRLQRTMMYKARRWRRLGLGTLGQCGHTACAMHHVARELLTCSVSPTHISRLSAAGISAEIWEMTVNSRRHRNKMMVPQLTV